jgi:hypothetical protein
MSKKPLFSDGKASDPAFVNIRAAKSARLAQIRQHCEDLWQLYEDFADPEFNTELKYNFDARYWEMYLTCFFITEGYKVLCPKPGPDVGIEYSGLRIWFEATSPTRGNDENPDQVPEMKFRSLGEEGEAQDTPNEKIILRYLNSISEKCLRQYPRWIQAKTISPEDAFVIAINPRELGGWEYADTLPPRILQAAFNIGPPYLTINRETLKTVSEGFHFRDSIQKKKGQSVSTGVFQSNQYQALSGLLCSRVDAANHPQTIGEDFQLVPNPNAKQPLPEKLRLKGTYFRIAREGDGYIAVAETEETP